MRKVSKGIERLLGISYMVQRKESKITEESIWI